MPHGLRLNSGKKQMIIRTFLDEESKLPVIYGKFPKGGTCIASAGKVILIGSFYETKDQVGATCNDTIQIMARYLNDSVWPAVDAADSGGVPAVSESQAKLTWQPFCDQMLVGKGHVAECLIADRGSGSVYAWSTCPQLRQKAEAAGGKASFGLLKYEAELPQEDGTDKVCYVCVCVFVCVCIPVPCPASVGIFHPVQPPLMCNLSGCALASYANLPSRAA